MDTQAEARHRLSAIEREAALTEWANAPLVLMETLHELSRRGVSEVHIVPGGDLHLAPWAGTLDHQVEGLTVRQFPSTANWLRVMASADDADSEARWACLSCDTPGDHDSALMWAAVEAKALAALWPASNVQHLVSTNPHWMASAGQAPVNGLIAIGHGNAPGNNWAMAGLVTGMALPNASNERKYSYFTSAQLHQIQHAKHLVLSCCVLGRLRDSQGEPLGMAAQAFNFNTRLAVGATIPIPDFEGALWSMALHWTWAQSKHMAATMGQPMDWGDVFHACRRDVMSGRWPLGFGAWLRTQFLAVVAQCDDAMTWPRIQHLRVEPHFDEGRFIEALALAPTTSVRQVATVTTCFG